MSSRFSNPGKIVVDRLLQTLTLKIEFEKGKFIAIAARLSSLSYRFSAYVNPEDVTEAFVFESTARYVAVGTAEINNDQVAVRKSL